MSKQYPYPTYEYNEDDLLNLIILQGIFPLLTKEQKVILGLRLLGFTQGSISRLLNISRTSVGSIEKQAISFLSNKMNED